MVEVALIHCKCRQEIHFVRKRDVDSDWLFARLEPLGIKLHVWGQDIACPGCGEEVLMLPEEKLDEFWERLRRTHTLKNVIKDEPFSFPTGSD